MKRILFLLIAALSCFRLSPAPLAAQEAPDIPAVQVQPGGDHPLGTWDGVTRQRAAAPADRLWSFRTGFRKGITDLGLPEENDAAPDVAVLRSGFFESWGALLASFQEPVLFVEHDGIAGLGATKPALIIPSGGLAGLSASQFFRAGLAEYVASGGVLLCFSQQKGADLSALPLPAGTTLTASGWTEDGGPLFRASAITQGHPVLAGVPGPVPAVETDGSISAVPAGGSSLLTRTDGKATLIVYPFGSGWVAVGALASDYAAHRDALPPDERTLVRNLVLWAKAAGKPAPSAPGARLDLSLSLPGPDQGTAASASVRVTGQPDARPLDERSFPLAVPPGQEAALAYSYTLPASAAPGIYRVEYRLLDSAQVALSPWAEVRDGWFFVPGPVHSAPAASSAPLRSSPSRIEAVPAISHAGKRTVLAIEVGRTPGTAGALNLTVRAAGQEQQTALTEDTTSVHFDLGPLTAEKAVSYAVHREDGRTVARGTVLAAPAGQPGVTLDRPWYLPGQTLKAAASGLGTGALKISGPGFEQEDLVSGNRTVDLPLPAALPAGAYELAWSFQSMRGEMREGSIPFAIKGPTLSCTGIEVVRTGSRTAEARLTVVSSGTITVQARIQAAGPGTAPLAPADAAVMLVPGLQTVSLPLAFAPDRAGIWNLLYSFTTPFPDVPGLAGRTAVLASGRAAIDAGDAAVIGLRMGRPVYYGTEEPASVTAFVYGRKGDRFELRADTKRKRKEKLAADGISAVTVPIEDLARGRHRFSASVTGTDLTGTREISTIYGARLPDLAVVLQSSDPLTQAIEIGVGVMNQGKVASGHVNAALYEGDPAKGGTLIQTAPVPPLMPGKQHVFIIRWSLAGKAGPRRIFAVVDPEGRTAETSTENNTASLALDIPEVLVTLRAIRPSFLADEAKGYHVGIVNFMTHPLPVPSRMDIEIGSPSGSFVTRETFTLPAVLPGVEQGYDRVLDLSVPLEGTYLVTANLYAADRLTASDSLGITVEPTLLLTGSLDGTPAVAVPCAPLTIRYAARDAGNVTPMNGTLKLEIRAEEGDRLVYAKQLPFVLGEGSVTIDRVDLVRGTYSVLLQGSAVNSSRDMRREYLLARQPLTVAGPVELVRSPAGIPRVLVWTGGSTATTIEQALAEKIVKETFADQPAYWKLVSSAAVFQAEALTGLYNIYLLLEVNELGDAVETLHHGIGVGRGVIVVGAGEHARSLAESLGFRYSAGPAGGTSLLFPADSLLGISGSVPVTGTAFSPAKSGSQPAAMFPGDQPAVRIDPSGPGKVLVAPFSLVHSALDAGASMPYSLFVRAAVQAVAPGNEEGQRPIAAVQLRVSSVAGPVRAKIVEALPPGAVVVWKSEPGAAERGTLSFELTAEVEPRTITYLVRATGASPRTTSEVFFFCDGKFASQGKVE